MKTYENDIWIEANIVFDLETGKTTQVFMLASHEADASTFSRADADTYLLFVKRRAPGIAWSIEASKQRPELFVIRGVQRVDI